MRFKLTDPEETQLVQLLDKATDRNAAAEDWTLFITICHKINRSPQAAKTTRKILQKKLASMIPQTQVLTISLLKVITENCRRFDEQLGHETLLKTLRNVWNHPDTYHKVRERIVECTYVWAMELGGYQPIHPLIIFSHEVNRLNSVASTPHTTAWNSTSPLSPHPYPSLPPQPQPQRQPQRQQINGSTPSIPSSGVVNVNRKSSLFQGWKLKRSSTTNTAPITSSLSSVSNLSREEQWPTHVSQVPPRQQQQQQQQQPSPPQPQPNQLQTISDHDKNLENNSQKIQTCIEESKTTSGLLRQLLSSDELGPDDSLLQELYQKCQDLQSNIMRYIQATSDPVYIGTLIDTNSLLQKEMDAYNNKKRSSSGRKVIGYPYDRKGIREKAHTTKW